MTELTVHTQHWWYLAPLIAAGATLLVTIALAIFTLSERGPLTTFVVFLGFLFLTFVGAAIADTTQHSERKEALRDIGYAVLDLSGDDYSAVKPDGSTVVGTFVDIDGKHYLAEIEIHAPAE